MREIDVKEVTKVIKELVIKANNFLPDDLVNCIKCSKEKESNKLALDMFSDMLDNLDAAKELNVPICQDTGMAVVFIEVGQDVHLINGNLTDAINEGVRQGYLDGLLRCSIVADPLNRVNTEDNTPAIVHTSIVSGDNIHINVAPKGFGSENMSKMKMFTPSSSREAVIDYIVDVVKQAGSNPCPPIVVGVGIGGDFEYAAYLSKKAVCRSVAVRNDNPYYSKMEEELLEKINKLNIGPQGFGGDITALAVNIMEYPTHIAGLPVAVNIGCHVTRHQSATI